MNAILHIYKLTVHQFVSHKSLKSIVKLHVRHVCIYYMSVVCCGFVSDMECLELLFIGSLEDGDILKRFW